VLSVERQAFGLGTHSKFGVNGFLMPILNYLLCLYRQNQKHGRDALVLICALASNASNLMFR
jgi:hypothetical protein